jgi:hypothetical protein
LLFGGEIELDAPFDPKKLKLTYSDADGWHLCHGVTYDGDDIDNNDLSTTGKWGESKWILGGDEEVYDPEESYDTPDCGISPSDWEKSPEFKFKQHKPVHVGWYNAVWSNFGTTYGTLYWDGENFVEFNYGKSNVISGVDAWSGYNWDTASWVNQPPEPPDVSCNNKKCGWIGMGSDRQTDDDYNDHCPACDGTEFSRIDYDPVSAKGRKNREKYCRPWDPELALSRILVPEQTLEEDLEEFEALIEKKTQAKWPF